MPYVVTNPPVLQIPSMGGHQAQWAYKSTDAHTAVDEAGYFTNGKDLGMKVNDVVIVTDTDVPSVTIHCVTTVAANGAVTISTATLA